MTAYQVFNLPKALNISSNLTLLSGAKALFELTGTSTATDTYQDSDLTTPHTNPVVADSAGVFPAIYLDPTIRYRLTLSTSADVVFPGYPLDDVNDQILSQAVIGALLYPRTAAEIAAGVTPTNYVYQEGHAKRYGALGDGATNDTAALLRMIAAMPADGGQIHFDDGDVYMVDADTLNGLHFSGKTNFKIFGNNSTVKVLSGESVVGGYGILYFTNCQVGDIENLTLDANRAGRTPVEAGAYNVVVQNTCEDLHFRRVHAPNAVIDGWTITTSAPATQSSYPLRITLEDCSADNAFRNGLSVIGSRYFRVIRGSFTNTNGMAPGMGIDVETDTGYTYGNTDILIDSPDISGNEGGGITITGASGTVNTGIRIRGASLSDNGDLAIHVARGSNVEIEDITLGDHTGDASFGLIQLGDPSGSVSDVRVRGVKATGITSTVAVAVVRVTGDVTGVMDIDDIKCTSIACRALSTEAPSNVSRIRVKTCTATNPAIQNSGAGSVFNDIVTDTTTAAGLYNTGADVEMDRITVIDYGASASAGIQQETGASGSITKNVTIRQRTSIPGGTYGIRYNGVAPRVVENICAKSAGTDFTTANAVGFLSGVANASIKNISPSLQVLTGAGAIDLAASITHLVTTGADAITLADGGEGQEKVIVMKTDGGAGTLTPTNLANGTTITFDDVDDFAVLRFTLAQWYMIGGTATLA